MEQSVHREEFTADQRNQLPEGQRGSRAEKAGCMILWRPWKPYSFTVLLIYVFTLSRDVTQ